MNLKYGIRHEMFGFNMKHKILDQWNDFENFFFKKIKKVKNCSKNLVKILKFFWKKVKILKIFFEKLVAAAAVLLLCCCCAAAAVV